MIELPEFPEIPLVKRYVDGKTPEQKVLIKCFNNIELDSNDENTLRECINFYKEVLPVLKSIDLGGLDDERINILKSYLNQVFSFEIAATIPIDIEHLFRVSIVRNNFLEKGRIRTPKYLTYPPIEIVKSNGVYNRANSFNKTVFYASFDENVALRETKPNIGDRIIISTWSNITGLPFKSYAIANSNVRNEGVSRARESLQKLGEKIPSLSAKLIKIVLAFLASEFVKEIEFMSAKKYEYLYSAYFSDKILSLYSEENPEATIDSIIYPSVAWKHIYDNVAINPDTADRKLKLIKVREFNVLSVNYEKELEINESPVELELIRSSDWIEKDDILWDDE